jgi:hypothetical protein
MLISMARVWSHSLKYWHPLQPGCVPVRWQRHMARAHAECQPRPDAAKRTWVATLRFTMNGEQGIHE